MIVHVDGRDLDAANALGADERGFLLGDGAFETALLRDGVPAFLDAHLERLRGGLAVLGIAEPEALAAVGDVFRRLAAVNGCGSGEAAARITVSRGRGGRGLAPASSSRPTFVVSVEPYRRPTGPAVLAPTTRRVYSGAATRGFKCLGGYVERILARADAVAAGAEEGLLLNEHGRLAGAGAATLFLLDRRGVLRTPSLADGALPGVVRAVVLEMARGIGLVAEEGGLDPGACADAFLFLTNSLVGLRPARLPGAADAPAPLAFHALEMRYRERLEDDMRRRIS